ncbi:hypothetical protein S7711_10832 [Stachybotrys chartarum IBT 7711]|uniref:Uncharacterized protein n=1 Tax=Stachybotrys chartarum (strain CBS 109288 / IBT 7711) TaxID=1280523 RepID=A0A084B5I3_STACB|nr:hypothetical protein S7711_10832 [Stachybotrys chartarum IBT 7711]KFA50703.1 hypothetical protein S40293_10868 [Stachybotrys chartarum IBT 40293]KFA81806.1 hypothetical protein S40288_11207 [Stachybotrys chartarum IBT 40288]
MAQQSLSLKAALIHMTMVDTQIEIQRLLSKKSYYTTYLGIDMAFFARWAVESGAAMSSDDVRSIDRRPGLVDESLRENLHSTLDTLYQDMKEVNVLVTGIQSVPLNVTEEERKRMEDEIADKLLKADARERVSGSVSKLSGLLPSIGLARVFVMKPRVVIN